MLSKVNRFIDILVFGGFSVVALSVLWIEGLAPHLVGRVSALLLIAALGYWRASFRGLSRTWGIAAFVIGWVGHPAVGLLGLLLVTFLKQGHQGGPKDESTEAGKETTPADASKPRPMQREPVLESGSEHGQRSMALLLEVMQEFEEGRAQFGIPFASPYGEQAIPILTETGQGKRAIYVDAGPWDKSSETKFLHWIALLRSSGLEDLDVEIRSEHEVPERLTFYSRREPRALFELAGSLQIKWIDDPNFAQCNAKLLKRLVWEYLEIELPGGIAGLQALDKLVIDKLCHEGKGHTLPSTFILLGSFFGETLISLYDGRWNIGGMKVEQVTVELRHGSGVVQANVFGKVMKLFDHGMVDSTAQMAKSVENLIT